MDPQAERWWLITQLPPAQPESKADLEILREVEPDEVRRTREANALLTRLAGAAPYARLVELFDEVVHALGRETTLARRAANANRAAQALGKVAQEFPGELRASAVADFGAASDELRELEAAVATETGRASFRLLVAVGAIDQGPFAAVDGALVNDAEAVEALGRDVPEIQAGTDLILALRAGVVVAQRLIGRQLQIYERRIDEASLYLRRLTAEVADGAPALMQAGSFDPEAGETTLGETTFDPLALPEALYLHRALRHARQLLADTNEAAAAGAPAGATSRSAPPEAGPPADAAAVEHKARRPAGDEEAAVDSVAGSEPPEPPPGDRQDQVLDLRALAQHATEFVDELEKAWSAALDAALLGEAQEEMNARYGSLLRSIQRRASAGDRAAEAAGLDPRLPALPLAPEEIAKLTLDPDPERCWRQLQLAETEALMLLLDALQGLREPSAQTIYIDEQRVETWWEAGAFALVRERAALLVRVSEELARAEAARMGTEAGPAAPDFLDRLRLASSALGHGDFEAALLHARQALELRAALQVEPVPDDLIERLAADPRLADEAPVLRLLGDAAERLRRGDAFDLGAATIAAPRALAAVGRLCLEAHDILVSALATENDEQRA